MKRPQDFIRDIWRVDLSIINSGEYVGNTHKDNAYTYAIKGLNDKYSNSFYDEEKDKVFNMWWSSFKNNGRTTNKDILRKSIIISKEAYDKVYGSMAEQIFDEYKKECTSNNKKCEYGNFLLHKLELRLEHLTPMQHSFNLLVNLKPNEIDDTKIKECFNYAGLALLTQDESKILDSGSKVNDDVIEELKVLQEEMGEDKINDCSINLAKELISKNGNAASLKSNGDGLIRIVYLYKNAVRFVSSVGRELSLVETITELIENSFTINQYKNIK